MHLPNRLLRYCLLLLSLLAFIPAARAAISFGAAGTIATGPSPTGSNTLAVAYPAGIAAGNLLVMVIGNKYPSASSPATPSGWTLAGQQAGGYCASGTTCTGGDSGYVYSTVFVRTAVGTESGSVTVTITGANSTMGRIFRYASSTAGATWDTAATTGTFNTPAAYNSGSCYDGTRQWCLRATSNPGIQSGDRVIVASARNGNRVPSWSNERLINTSGITVGTNTERLDNNSGTGDDMGLIVSDHTITAGTATEAPYFVMNGGGSGISTSPAGSTVFLRIREVPPQNPPTVTKSFSPTSVSINGTSVMTTTITNPASNTVALTGLSFTDTYPTNLVNKTPLNTSNTCGGTLTATAGGASLALSGGTVGVNTSCTITVQVTSSVTTWSGATNTPYVNSVTVSAANASGPAAAASTSPGLTVVGTPSVTTNAATNVLAYSATLNGMVNSNGANVTAIGFQYSLDTSYAYSITATSPSVPFSGASIAITQALEGIGCNKTIHYRAYATNAAGTSYGGDQTLTTTACTAPFPANACPAARFGNDLNCTANDVNLTNITYVANTFKIDNVAVADPPTCQSGKSATLELDLTVNFASPDRSDIGIFVSRDGKLPTLLSANGGSTSCSVDTLPISTTTPTPTWGHIFSDLDGVPQGTTDTCGDGNSSTVFTPIGATPAAGAGTGIKRMSVTLPCFASTTSAGKMYVPFAVSWDNQKSPIGGLCYDANPDVNINTSNIYPVPNTTSKCNAPPSTVYIDVIVMPVITKTNGRTTLNPGSTTTYSVKVWNNSGGTLLDSVLKDPAVAGLTVTGVTCSGTNGGVCPSGVTVSALQNAGITIPSANLPNDSYLTFSVTGTVTASVGQTLTNTATVSISTVSVSASDSDTIELAPAPSKSFTPSTISTGASSVLTITLTNPTASAVTNVAFTDTYPFGLVNTNSPGGSTTCGSGTVEAFLDNNYVKLTNGTIPANGSCTVTVNVTSATVGTYLNDTGTVTSSYGDLGSASATLTVESPVYGAFNACDVQTAPNSACTSTTTISTSHIATKIAGSPFSLDIVALKTDGTRNTSYGTAINVYLLDASDNSGTLDSYNCRSSWTTVIATLTPAQAWSSGLHTVGTFTVNQAYKDVRVKITNASGSTRIGCSTNNFAIRPNNLVVTGKDVNWVTAGTSRTLDNLDLATAGSSNGTPAIHKAGRNFNVEASAVNAAGNATTNFTITDTSKVVATASSCSPAGTACTTGFGTFAMTAAGFASGALSTPATYAEVGAFKLTLQETSFADVDADDTAADCNGRYTCGSGNIGRFVPDHFVITAGAPTPGCGSSFTYFGQDGFTTTFTLEAHKYASGVTTYYAGSWAKLPLTSWAGFNFAVSPWSPSQPSGAALAASITAPSGNWASGTTTVTAKHKVTRPTNPAAPTTISLTALPVDSDGVATVATDGLTNEAKSVNTGSILLRYGRLRLINTYGSELLPARVEYRSEYWDTNRWVTNTADTCTALTVANLYAPGLTGASVSPLTNGIGFITFNKAATGNYDIAFNLNATGSSDSSCNASPTPGHGGTAANLPWLQGSWGAPASCNSVAAYAQDPSARIKFGSPKAPFIYLRERY